MSHSFRLTPGKAFFDIDATRAVGGPVALYVNEASQDAPQRMLVPFVGRTMLRFLPGEYACELEFHNLPRDAVRIIPHSKLNLLGLRIRRGITKMTAPWMRGAPNIKRITKGGGRLEYMFVDTANPQLSAYLKALAKIELFPSSPFCLSNADILFDQRKEDATVSVKSVVAETQQRIGIVVHADDGDSWREIEQWLGCFPASAQVFVTTGAPDLLKPLVQTFSPGAIITPVDEASGAFAGFLELFYAGAFDGVDLLCKLNAVRSGEARGLARMRVALSELVRSTDRVRLIVERFDAEPALGVIAPSPLRIVSSKREHDPAWARVADVTNGLAELIGCHEEGVRRDYILGGAFWVRTDALRPYRDLNMSMANFAGARKPNPSAKNLERALEYLFCPAIALAGYKIAAATENTYAAGRSLSRDVLQVQSKIERRLPDIKGKRVCVFVSLALDCRISRDAKFYMRALKNEGFLVHLAAITPEGDSQLEDPGPEIADGVSQRANQGWDFACWAAILKSMPELWEADELLLANDSVIGPLTSLTELMTRVRQIDADIVGLVECRGHARHFQSFFLLFRPPALVSPALRRFWTNVTSQSDKASIVRAYELAFVEKMEFAGLKCEAVFPAVANRRGRFENPTSVQWKDLIEAGFPFVKKQLLRNPDFLRVNREYLRNVSDAAFDMSMIDEAAIKREAGQLAEVFGEG